ncbi:tumor necrosis factor ligand superfamily member 10 isoform X3 [Entelurus aequoreus]|uniref:tumor necrosis factor ligand superfamily member 10 isoform X3 n=1 Tax=Entelurus aequoreus TaxID=161455 RepID=UPI002B1D4BE9|nr:tumor necrosis factor ligand superfamily member 10 isoform X3 [Entelurus aequoreus]XP_061876700.1 tumor necrosis factor ligand superfamily member 10 isoform X3 [Entelurus aequoreus]
MSKKGRNACLFSLPTVEDADVATGAGGEGGKLPRGRSPVEAERPPVGRAGPRTTTWSAALQYRHSRNLSRRLLSADDRRLPPSCIDARDVRQEQRVLPERSGRPAQHVGRARRPLLEGLAAAAPPHREVFVPAVPEADLFGSPRRSVPGPALAGGGGQDVASAPSRRPRHGKLRPRAGERRHGRPASPRAEDHMVGGSKGAGLPPGRPAGGRRARGPASRPLLRLRPDLLPTHPRLGGRLGGGHGKTSAAVHL